MNASLMNASLSLVPYIGSEYEYFGQLGRTTIPGTPVATVSSDASTSEYL